MRYIITFITLFPLWIIWSGKFDTAHLVYGVICTGIVSIWSGRLFLESPKTPLLWRIKSYIKMELYSFWLLYEVFLSNMHVIKVALHPKMEDLMDPKMIHFKSDLSEMGQFILAQSITLTPGTVTVKISNGEFIIHALTQQTADGVPGEMANKVKRIFAQ